MVEVDGTFLYLEDLLKVLPDDLSKEDSTLFAERYMRDWVEHELLFEKARTNISDSAEIEKQVNQYREALIMHSYQQTLIAQTLSEEVSEEELTDYYEKHQELFKVERPLIKGLFIKVPMGAPKLNNVRRWYKMENREAVENLEKYSLQSAVKYEYFYDRWVPVAEVADLIPLKLPDMGEYLNRNRHVELKDDAFYYFLNVSDYRGIGDQEPYEFARTQVKGMLMNMKQVEFMKQVKEDLYRRAEKRDRIKYY